jgi:ABC-type antimicrobial peptide transport system permease subunit
MTVPLKYNFRSLLQRKTRSALTVLGIAAVVAVFVAMVAFGRGMAASFARTGSPDNLVVLQKGAFSQSLSSLPKNSRDVVDYLPHVRKKGDRILASPELLIEPWVKTPGITEATFMVARGVTPVFFDVADTLKVPQGAADLSGNRVLLGRGAQQKLGGVRVGDTITMFGEQFGVRGIFETGGTNLEFEVLADLTDLMRAANRKEYSSFTLKLDNEANADRAISLVENDRRVLLTGAREQDYYANSGKVYAVLAQIGLLISLIVAVGAIFGGMNTMYTAVSGRKREIGTLRALGFSKNSILVSFLAESLLLSLAGGAAGVVLGCLVNGLRVSVMSANIRFTVGAEVILGGLLLSVVVGLVGGLLPAHGASRTPVVEAMRSL